MPAKREDSQILTPDFEKASRSIMVLAAVALAATASHADFHWKLGGVNDMPDPLPVYSPQIGGTIGPGGGLFGGATASLYFKKNEVPLYGIGAGMYKDGDAFSMDLLLKTTLMGLCGASFGPSLRGGDVGIGGDVWVSLAIVGLRYRFTSIDDVHRHTLAVFVPLGLWSW